MNKEKLIDYLYQEMHSSERKVFEQDGENVRLAKDLREVRSFLQSDSDETPRTTPIFIKPKRKIVFSKWWAMAASLALLLSAGKLFNVKIEKSAQSLILSYGQNSYEKAQSDERYNEILTTVANLQRDLNTKMEGLQNVAYRAPEQKSTVNQRESTEALKRILAQENSLFAEELTQQLQESQQAYTLEVINTLLDYWDGQRKQDLDVVNTNLRNLAQTIQLNSDEFAQFTNQSVQNY